MSTLSTGWVRFVEIYSRVVAVGVFLLLIAGALVTSTGSGLAVPDWPLSYGMLMPKMVGGIFYEHGHRLVAAAVSTLVGVLVGALFLTRRAVGRKIFALGAAAFGAILLQAVLGGLTVLHLLPPALSSAHAGLAQLVFALVASVALLVSKPFREGAFLTYTQPSGTAAQADEHAALDTAFARVLLATVAIYGQILLGAVMRHTGAGLAIPDFPLSFGRLWPTAGQLSLSGVPVHLAHRMAAIVVLILVCRAAASLFSVRPVAFSRMGGLWVGLLASQTVLGALSVLTKRAVAITTAHLAVGALTWVLGVLVAVALHRLRGGLAVPAPVTPTALGGSYESIPRPSDRRTRMSRVADFVELTKPRITFFVVLTAFVGFVIGSRCGLAELQAGLLLHTLFGTALVASGTSAFNQLREAAPDARMRRTAGRPLPSGRLSEREALLFATSLATAGVLELWIFANTLTAALAALTLLSYVFVYTPMKRHSAVSMLVGAVPGALPPLGGFTAARGFITAEGVALFLILFLWQLPHFLAIGWRHREDYARAGFRNHATLDPTGRTSGIQAFLYAAALFPAVAVPGILGTAGLAYGVGALLFTTIFVVASYRFLKRVDDTRALELFLVSIGWLPAVLILLVVDRVIS